MKRKTFAARLSFKTVLIGVLIFLATLLILAIVGGRIMNARSIKFSKQCLHNTALEAQATFNTIECTTDAIAATTEEFLRTGIVLDTSRCFRLLNHVVESSPFILGSGFYYEPYAFDKKNYYSGIYVSRDKFTGETVKEWDDDEACAEDGWDYFSLDWYTIPKKEGKKCWTPPALENMTTYYQLMTSYTYPLNDKNGNMYGVFSTDLSLDFLLNQLEAIRPYNNCNVIIADKDYKFICNPLSNDPFSGSMLDTPFIPGINKTLSKTELQENDGSLTVRDGAKKAFVVFEQMENGWTIAVAVRYEDAFHDLFMLWLSMLGMAIIGIILLYLISRYIIYKESRPIVAFAEAASKITDGRFDVPIPEVKTKDEMKDLGNALSFMQESVTNYIEELKTTTSEKERLASELNVAHAIQKQMLTDKFPELDSIGIHASSYPAKEVGGDLYDFFISGQYLYFIIGDVSGKGVPAALLMAITIAAFRATIKNSSSTADVVSTINDTFCQSNEDLMFVTVIVGKINLDNGKVEFCNGGHNPMVITDKNGNASFIQAKPNIACGAFSGFPYKEESFTMEKGSRLVIYTDGVTEAETVEKDQYGESRLIEWAKTYACNTANSDEECVASLENEVKTFTNGANQSDDITIMSISR